MRVGLVALSAAVAVGLAALVAWWRDISFSRALILSPFLLLVFGAAAGLVVLWARAARETLRRRGRA